MLSPKSFRYQIVLTFSIIFAALWGGSIFVFKNHLKENLIKEQKIEYKNYQKVIQQEVKNQKKTSQYILKKISTQLGKKPNISIKNIMRIWNNMLLKPDGISLSYYDKNHKHTEISENYESFFYSPLALEKSVMSPHDNLIEGGHFFHCKKTCRFYYIKPALNHSFNQGTFQTSLSLNKLTTKLIEDLENIDIFALKKRLMVTS